MNTINEFRDNYRFLSNFWSCTILFEGEEYNDVESAFQAAKTLDKSWRQSIRLANRPGEAKKIGRQAPMRSNWHNIRLSVMEDLLRQKFSNSELRRKLLETGESELIEGNNWKDVFWGVDHKLGGENNLGKLLMKIRSEIRDNIERE